MKKLKGALFNLEYGRDKQVVKGEVESLIEKHNLDFLITQEAADYIHQLDNIDGFTYYVNRSAGSGGLQVGILVKDKHTVDRVKTRNLGDGWTTIAGPHHAPLSIPTVRINGWLKVMGLHAPTPTDWVNGVLHGPPDRVDDYKALARYLLIYFGPPIRKTARLAGGDWNENPDTLGRYAPRWIAQRSGARRSAPSSMAGHGRIDWVMHKGCTIETIFKDLSIREGSDHEPVVFVVRK